MATLIARGVKSGAIGERLGIAPNTVGVYRQQILKKLEVGSTAGIVHHAIKEGWVRIGELEGGTDQ